MAKRHHHRRHSTALARYTPRMPKPIVIKTTKVVKAKGRHHRHHGGGFGMGSLMSPTRLGLMAGGFALGVLEKQGMIQKLPALPIIGVTGTVAVAAHLLSNGGRNKLASEIATVAMVVAAHELAASGSIIGGDANPEVGYVAGW